MRPDCINSKTKGKILRNRARMIESDENSLAPAMLLFPQKTAYSILHFVGAKEPIKVVFLIDSIKAGTKFVSVYSSKRTIEAKKHLVDCGIIPEGSHSWRSLRIMTWYEKDVTFEQIYDIFPDTLKPKQLWGKVAR